MFIIIFLKLFSSLFKSNIKDSADCRDLPDKFNPLMVIIVNFKKNKTHYHKKFPNDKKKQYNKINGQIFITNNF